jgi:hypothetical protein
MSANDANSTVQFEALLDYVLKSRGFDFTAKRSSLEAASRNGCR